MNDPGRPRVTCSITTSLDGYIDDLSAERLVISSPEHLEYVDELRASHDAILVGAGTLRGDNPALVIRSQRLREARVKSGFPPDPAKIAIVSKGELSERLSFFSVGEGQKILYCPRVRLTSLEGKVSLRATLVPYDSASLDPVFLLADLLKRGIKRLLVEGGERVHSMFMSSSLVDELQLAVGSFFVGEKGAPRFVMSGHFPFNKENPFHLDSAEKKGNTALLKYSARR